VREERFTLVVAIIGDTIESDEVIDMNMKRMFPTRKFRLSYKV
jgi:hypothetical protein